jgi:hypothetical protein
MPDAELPDLLKEQRGSRPLWRRILYVAAAVFCFLAGIFGWLIPVMTGIPFYIVGFVFLAMASDRAAGWVNRLERRLPESWRKGLRRAIRKVPSKRLQKSVNLPDAKR